MKTAHAIPQIKLLFASPDFFTVKPKLLLVEASPVTNRTYFIWRGRILAVGEYA